MRLKSDLVELCIAAIEGRLNEVTAQWDPRPALGVVLAAEGYPGSYGKGETISGLDTAFDEFVKVFHAGTATENGRVLTAGGRVLCVTALGDSVSAAQKAAYSALENIHWNGANCRSDIGYRAIAREQA
jgi:phosphoribosylamine--glycine ligase